MSALDLKNVIEDIVSSYEARIEDVSSIFEANQLILGEFQEDIPRLRDILAKNEHLRKKDFDNMMQGILLTQAKREREIRDLLRDYFSDQRALAQTLKENLRRFKDSLIKGEAQRVKEFHAVIKEILAKQNERKDYITSKLKEFQEEQRYLAIELKELLTKGDNLRIKDFKSMLKEFKVLREKRLALQKKRKEEVAKMLGGFKNVRKKLRLAPGAVNIDGHHNER